MRAVLAFATMSGTEVFVEWDQRYDIYASRAKAESEPMPEPTGEIRPNRVEEVVILSRADFDRLIGDRLALWEPPR